MDASWWCAVSPDDWANVVAYQAERMPARTSAKIRTAIDMDAARRDAELWRMQMRGPGMTLICNHAGNRAVRGQRRTFGRSQYKTEHRMRWV